MTTLNVTPTVNLDLSSDSGVVGDDITKVTKPTFSGTAAAGASVQVRIDGKLVGTAPVNAKGQWTFTLSAPLSSGKHAVTATALNPAGNASAAAHLALTIDTSSPKPTLHLAAGSDSGAAGDDITNVTKPTFTGTAAAGSTVTVQIDGKSAGTAVANAAGKWSFTSTAALASGMHTVTATAMDVAGNASAPSNVTTLTIQTSSAKPTIQLASGADSGVAGDGITNAIRPTFTGTAAAGSKVTVQIDGKSAGTAVTNAAGQWSFTPTAVLPSGKHTVTATAVDSAGNVSVTANLALTIDTSSAKPTIQLAAGSDSGVAGDGITNAAKPTFTGTAEAGSKVTVQIDGTSAGNAVANAAGQWSFTPTAALASGKHTVTVIAVDVAGNVSAPCNLALTIDTSSAKPTIQLAAGSDSGVAGDGITKITDPALIGTATADARVAIQIDGKTAGTAVANTLGQWKFSPTIALSSGSHTITAIAVDGAGNTSAATSMALVIDPSSPTPTVGLAPASDSGVAGDGITDVTTPTLTGVAEAGSTVTVRIDGAIAGTVLANASGVWALTPSAALSAGSHMITATSLDVAGVTSASGSLKLQIAGGSTSTGSSGAPPPPPPTKGVVTAPAIAQPSSPGDVVGLQLQNTQASSLAAREITFGQQFADGQVPSGKSLVARIGGVTVSVQMDVKTRYADGSVQTAVLTLQQPALAANSSTAVMLALGTASAAPPVDISALTSLANYNVTVTLSGITEHSGSSSVKIADQSFNLGALLKQALASGQVSYWLQGPQATQVEFQTTVPGTPLRLVFDITRYADGTTSTDVQFNNDIAMQASLGSQTTSLSYNVSIQQNGASVLQQNGITQWQYQTWQQQFWSNGAPQVNVQHDIAALEKTGLIQNYDLNLGVAGSVISNEASHLGGANFGILGPGDITQVMTWTAGRPDIGPQPRWVASWLVSQSGAAQTYMLAQANAAGSIPWHLYDPTTGNYVTATSDPTLWVTPRTGPTQPPADMAQSGWVPDPSHQPDSDYIAYLATGDSYYLDQLNAQAAYDILFENPDGRQQSAGIVADLKAPVRAQAWSLREIIEAAAANPDGSAMKAYFTQIATNNISYLLSQLPALSAAEGAVSGWFPPTSSQAPGATTPWQQDFMATTLGLAAGMGIPGAAQVLAWQTNFLAGLFTSDAAGFPATDGVPYFLQVEDPKTLTPYTTWAQVEAGSQAQGLVKNAPGVLFKSADYQAAAKAALAESITWTGSTKAMQVYGWLLANATADNAAYNQSQPSEDIVPRLTDGNLLTASMVFIRNDVGAVPLTISATNSDQLIYEKGSAPATIVGGAGINLLFGGSGSTTLVGGSNNDYLYAGSGSTVFQPGAGNDFMQAGSGAATFDLSATDIGNDLIAGFKLATDRLSILGDAPGSAALTTLLKGATQDASGNAVLHLAAGHDVTLLGITQTQIVPALFS